MLRALQIGEKSVARFARDDDDGQDWQRRLVRRPSSALPFDREDPTGADERRRRGCAYSHLVRILKFDTGLNVLRAAGLLNISDLSDETYQ